MIVLSLLFVAILIVETRVSDGWAFTLLLALDLAIWAVFVADYIYRLKLAERRLTYALQPLNLVDLVVVALPLFIILGAGFLGVARLGRLLRLFGFLRVGGLAASNIKRATSFLTRPINAKIALSLALLLSVIAAVGVWAAEQRSPGSTLESWPDTLWVGLGYGDDGRLR